MNKKTPGKKSIKKAAKAKLKASAAPAIKPKTKAAALPKSKPKPKPTQKAKPPVDDEPLGLGDVMASLQSIFGGRNFSSDADLESFLDSKIASGEIPPSAALDPLDEAQSLIYEAWNTEGPEKIHLARRALELSEDCADAYLILAEEEAKSLTTALSLYQKGLAAAKRTLDPGLFKDSVGKFWEIMETRPYMRARLGLAECLWDLGKKSEAMENLWEMLRLNPGDNQGVRYLLVEYMLESGTDARLGELLSQYAEDSTPEMRYSHALWVFKREGSGQSADSLLAQAIEANSQVPAYLLKRLRLPKELSETVSMGSTEEAEAYVMGALGLWQKTPGALEWLEARAPGR